MPLLIRYDVDGTTVETWGRPRMGKVAGINRKADQGTVGASSLLLPDPTGAHETRGLRRLYMAETDGPTDAELIYDGYLGPRDTGRDAEHFLGAHRLITVSLHDTNTLLENYLIQGPKDAEHGVRPDETDLQRIAWYLGSAFTHPIQDFGAIATTGGVMLDGADLRGQRGASLLRDAGLMSGRNWFLYYDESQATENRIGLFYNYPHVPVWNSTLRLTNHPGDADDIRTAWGNMAALTFDFDSGTPPVQHTKPDQVFSGVLVEYDGGSVFVDAEDIGLTTKTDYYVRETTTQAPNIKKLATARRLGERYLRDHSREEKSASARILLPSSHVALVQPGHRIESRFDHFDPEFRDFTYWRINELTWAQKSRKWYWVDVNMDPLPTECPLPTEDITVYPLGGTTHDVNLSTTGNVVYLRSGIVFPRVVSPGHDGSVHFFLPGSSGGGVGTTDMWGRCVGNELRFLTSGDGTWTISTAVGGAFTNLRVQVYHVHADGVTEVLDSTVFIAAGDDVVVPISTHGQEFCSHWVSIRDKGPTCGDAWGWTEASWVKAAV